MIHVAICDRDASTCCHIEELIKDSLKHFQIYFEEFSNSIELYQSVCEHILFDIIFMDISFEKEQGISVISHIRNTYGKNIIVIYLSHSSHQLPYISDMIDTHPFAFLSKPINQDILRSKLLSAFHELFPTNGFFEFKTKGKICRIPLDHIIYIEKTGRILNINTKTNVYTTYCKIDDVYHNLTKKTNALIRIQYSYIVNMRYITEYTSYSIFIGDMELSISKNYRSKLFQSFRTNSV